MVVTRKRALEFAASVTKVERTPTKKAKGVSPVVQDLFDKSCIVDTTTKNGWCLKEGMNHVLEADKSRELAAIVQRKGLPAIYGIVEGAACRHSKAAKDGIASSANKPQNCFQSLCRIIAGQQLAGSAARAVWRRLVEHVEANTTEAQLTPSTVLALAGQGMEAHLQKPAGLSGAKGRSIVALSQAFHEGNLTEEFLTSPSSSEEDIRSKLLAVRGIGPWTCDMFLMFYLEKGNVFPIGDLGVRKGIAKFFGLKGRGYKGSLCQKKDKEMMETVMAPYRPYQSLVTYYMWTVADTKDFYRDASKNENDSVKVSTTFSNLSSEDLQRGSAVVTP